MKLLSCVSLVSSCYRVATIFGSDLSVCPQCDRAVGHDELLALHNYISGDCESFGGAGQGGVVVTSSTRPSLFTTRLKVGRGLSCSCRLRVCRSVLHTQTRTHMSAHTRERPHTHTHTRMHTHTHTYTCAHTHTHKHMSMRALTHTYILSLSLSLSLSPWHISHERMQDLKHAPCSCLVNLSHQQQQSRERQ